jgi:hypothetical protein
MPHSQAAQAKPAQAGETSSRRRNFGDYNATLRAQRLLKRSDVQWKLYQSDGRAI